jgi:hypothetical protein
MVKPFADFDDYREQQEAKGDRHYEQSMLMRVAKALLPDDAIRLRRQAGDEWGFRWFNDNVDTLRISLDAMHASVHVRDLLRTTGITKTKLWQRYFDLRNEYGSPFGLIFPVPGMSQWIMHDEDTLALEPGCANVVRISANAANRLVTQPLAAFIEAVKRL